MLIIFGHVLDHKDLFCHAVFLGDQQSVARLHNVFADLHNPFSQYFTEHIRTKAFTSKGMIEPRAVSAGTRLETVSRTLKTCQTLQQLFSNQAFGNSFTVAKG